MRKIAQILITLLVVHAFSTILHAGDWQGISSTTASPAKITLNYSNISTSEVSVSLTGYNRELVKTPRGTSYIISVGEGTPILEKGSPDLMKLTTSVIIPDEKKMKIEVISSKYEEYSGIQIAPSKGNLLRTVDPSKVSYEYGEAYNTDAFYPGELAALRTPYIARDYRGQAIIFYPFQYNPVSEILRVYTELTVRIVSTEEPGENELIRKKSFDVVSKEFNRVYEHHFLNAKSSRYTPLEEYGKMLIISPASYMTAMQPFVDWKKQIGRDVEIVDVSTIGTQSSQIKSYITNYYNNNNLAYVLLVGDAAQIPASYSNGDSDNEYGYILGNDHYQEIFIGRFSAETVSQVETQVARTITYEKGTTLATGWLNRTMGIASSQGPGDDNEYDYQHVRNMQTDLTGFTYVTPTIELFDGSQGGNDAAGNPTPTMVGNELNTGAGSILYTGHGSTTSWSSSGFSNSNINALTNVDKLPFIWSVACVNGNFVGTTCFAEAWMRATDNNNPTGAIGILASTINQSWDPPMEGQDEMVDILVESYTNNIKRSFAGISINGCFKMNDTYGSGGNDMTDTWTCFGDPSVMVRTDDPASLSPTHLPTVFLGSSQFEVSNLPDSALVSLTINNEIIGTATAGGGVANVSFDPLTDINNIKVTVTAFNYAYYEDDVQIIAPSGPYVIYKGLDINDNSGNNNGLLDYGESVSLNFTVENVGPDLATDVDVTISTNSPYVLLIDSTENFGDILAEDSATIADAFSFILSEDVPDQETIQFSFSATENLKESWSSSFYITANAPDLNILSMSVINDNNGDGALDPGETAELIFEVENAGHADAENPVAWLEANSPYLTFIDNHILLSSYDALTTTDVAFEVEANASAPDGSIVDLEFKTFNLDTLTKSFEFVIGQLPQITIGTGSQSSSYYPFYTYYENNKSQMLYLANEFGSGAKTIQEIAYDFTTIGLIPNITNLVIKFMHTPLTQIGTSYENTSGATTVFSSANYTMPTTTGWHTFDINDFDYNGTDNLLIEITWGDNGSWDDEFVVASTTSPFTSVAYGYSDTETPPLYDGNSNIRPNLFMEIASDPVGDEYNLDFIVVSDTISMTPVPDAKVMIGSLVKTVNTSGQTTFSLLDGTYEYTGWADNYTTETGSVVINGADDQVVILINSSIGLPEKEKNNIAIFPNPANEICFIKNASGSELILYNIVGEQVMKSRIDNDLFKLQLNQIPQGYYLLKIVNEKGMTSKKLLITK